MDQGVIAQQEVPDEGHGEGNGKAQKACPFQREAAALCGQQPHQQAQQRQNDDCSGRIGKDAQVPAENGAEGGIDPAFGSSDFAAAAVLGLLYGITHHAVSGDQAGGQPLPTPHSAIAEGPGCAGADGFQQPRLSICPAHEGLKRQTGTNGAGGIGQKVKEGCADPEEQEYQIPPGPVPAFREKHNEKPKQRQVVDAGKLHAQGGGDGIEHQQSKAHGQRQPEPPLPEGQQQHPGGQNQLQGCIHHPDIAQREKQQQRLEKEQVAMPVPGIVHHIAGPVSVDVLLQRAGRVELPFGELHAVIAHGGLHGILIPDIDGGLQHDGIRIAIQTGAFLLRGPAEAGTLVFKDGQTPVCLGQHPPCGKDIHAGHEKNACQNGKQQADKAFQPRFAERFSCHSCRKSFPFSPIIP